MAPTIDLNADLGEECGDDLAMLAIVTSASIAAGGHAGGGDVLARTVRAAAERGVRVGAHPSYPDRPGFGRTSLLGRMGVRELAASVTRQVAEVGARAHDAAIALSHVKAHGALYHDLDADESLARAYLDAIDAGCPGASGDVVPVMCQGGGALERMALAQGRTVITEGFADRGYAPDGSLVARSAPHALIEHADAAAAQAVAIARDEAVRAVDGTVVAMRARSLCLHGDSPGAVRLALSVREALEAAGIAVAAWPA